MPKVELSTIIFGVKTTAVIGEVIGKQEVAQQPICLTIPIPITFLFHDYYQEFI